MIPEAIILRLYGSLHRFVSPGRALVLAFLVFYPSDKLKGLLFGRLFNGSVSEFYEVTKSVFLESSFFYVLVSFFISFIFLPWVNRFFVSNLAKFETNFTGVLEDRVERAVSELNVNQDLHELQERSESAYRSIRSLFMCMEALCGVSVAFLWIFVYHNGAVNLALSLVFLVAYFIFSYLKIKSIMILYISRIIYYQRVVQRLERIEREGG